MALFGRSRARKAVAQAALARNLGQRDEARSLAERALRLDPACEPAQDLLARLLPRSSDPRDLEDAIDRLQALLDAGARAPQVWLRRAACLVEAGRPEEALAQLDVPLADDAAFEDRVERLQYRKAALFRLERWDDAVQVLHALRELDAGHPVLHDLAHALERAGQAEPALALRRSLARFRPDDWYRFLRTLPPERAQTMAESLGTTAQALQDLPPIETLARLDPSALDDCVAGLPEPWPDAIRGHAHRAAERRDQAQAALAKAGDHPAARLERALLDMCADTIDRSVEALERLTDEGVPLPGLAYWRAVAHHAADHDERAATLYRALLDDAPDHGHAWLLLADVLRRHEGPEAALQARRRGYRATPLLLVRSLRMQLDTIVGVAGRVRMGRLAEDDPALVSACTDAGDTPRAQALLRAWARRDELDDDTRVQLAREGLSAEAHESIASLLAPLVEAEHPAALAIAGESLVVSGKPRLGAERLRRAVAHDPSLTRAWDFLGVVHAQHQEWAEADEPLHHAVRLGPDGPERHRNLAAFLLDTRRGAEAVAPAEAAVAMLPVEGGTLALLARAYQAAGDHPWAVMAAWAADFHQERHLHRLALGGVELPLPGNVPPPPDVFRPSIGRFLRRLEEISLQV
ncbi:MAG: tetratricopeptide repeat protein [Myxococcales bacterium]|nr:tetratricopeptide repeat protein [Myxococcales bacterium]